VLGLCRQARTLDQVLVRAQSYVFHTEIVYTILVYKTSRRAIGVFDSGFGGLTVLKALIEAVPEADYLYFGDTARLPYGSKSVETVAKYACEAARFLEHQGAGLLVIACNTATALALPQIQGAVTVSALGVVEPGAQGALAASRVRKAVVIGTEATISSHAYQAALSTLGMEAREKACPLLVPLVEEGWVDHPVTEQVAGIYLKEAFADGFAAADVLLLGCTHYPLLKPVFRRIVPEGVTLVDSADSIALAVLNLISSGTSKVGPRQVDATKIPQKCTPRPDQLKFFVTDSIDKFRRLGRVFLGREIQEISHVDLKE
jgi:glutamate racemase